MEFEIRFSTESNEFSDGELQFVVADTLRRIADKIEGFECGVDNPLPVFDTNGNRIGEARYIVPASRYANF